MTSTEEVAAKRISFLRKLHENPTPELKAEFKKLNERMIELCPRVHTAHWEALEKAGAALAEFDKLIEDDNGQATGTRNTD